MRIAILGAGAMGSAIGALLARAGHDVTLIDVWKDAVEAINRDGLKIQNKAGEIDVMCGAIVEAGQRLGFATPYNKAMLWLVKALEANCQKGV